MTDDDLPACPAAVPAGVRVSEVDGRRPADLDQLAAAPRVG